MEAFLRALLPRLLPNDRTFQVYPFQGKPDLLAKLESRLRGYSTWLPPDWRVVVVVDRDNKSCRALKRQLETIAQNSGLVTRARSGGPQWQLVNRIAIEELEAWYFGDWAAVREAYPRVSPTIPNRQGFRDSDAITGGTWEAFERVMQRHGYFEGGLRKVEAARVIGAIADPMRSSSASFMTFCGAVAEWSCPDSVDG